MYVISDQILREAENNNLNIKELSDNEKIKIFKGLKSKYIKKQNTENQVLWENLILPNILENKDSWKYIKDFVGTLKCILFFNLYDDKKAFFIQNGNDLNILLSETYGFEFYITNEFTDYLICFNHHDCLFCCGKASFWLKDIKNT